MPASPSRGLAARSAGRRAVVVGADRACALSWRGRRSRSRGRAPGGGGHHRGHGPPTRRRVRRRVPWPARQLRGEGRPPQRRFRPGAAHHVGWPAGGELDRRPGDLAGLPVDEPDRRSGLLQVDEVVEGIPGEHAGPSSLRGQYRGRGRAGGAGVDPADDGEHEDRAAQAREGLRVGARHHGIGPGYGASVRFGVHTGLQNATTDEAAIAVASPRAAGLRVDLDLGPLLLRLRDRDRRGHHVGVGCHEAVGCTPRWRSRPVGFGAAASCTASRTAPGRPRETRWRRSTTCRAGGSRWGSVPAGTRASSRRTGSRSWPSRRGPGCSTRRCSASGCS